MEEEIEHLKELKEELSYILDKTNLASETHLNYHRKVMAIEFVLNELERLQKDNEEYRIGWCNKGEECERLKKENYKLDRENQLTFEENQQLKSQIITYEVDNKEVSDALHMLLHCSLKDTEYVTQVGQFNIVSKYIKQLETENKELKNKKYIMSISCDGEYQICEHYKNGYLIKTENQQLKKGINSLMNSRKKWKDRYYKLKTENLNISRELIARTDELNKLLEENKVLKEDLKYVLDQILGAFENNWCIDWNFTEIREKYNLEEE